MTNAASPAGTDATLTFSFLAGAGLAAFFAGFLSPASAAALRLVVALGAIEYNQRAVLVLRGVIMRGGVLRTCALNEARTTSIHNTC